MKEPTPLTTLAARVLEEDARPGPVDPASRAAAIAAVRETMRRERRRRHLWMAGAPAGLLAAAASLLLVVRARPAAAPSTEIVATTATTPVRSTVTEPPSAERFVAPPPIVASAEPEAPLPPPSATVLAHRPGRPSTDVASGENATASPDRVRASDLAKQNDLFDRAIARKQAGDPRGAVAALDELLQSYPSTRLAQSARADRMKLLRDLDPPSARRAAEEYLRLYPAGFARKDAELIVSAP
jgi:hypothetical protein